MFTPHVSHVRCHMAGVRCQVSGVTCDFFLLFLLLGQLGGASRWKVCYQRGLLRPVLSCITPKHYACTAFKGLPCHNNTVSGCKPDIIKLSLHFKLQVVNLCFWTKVTHWSYVASFTKSQSNVCIYTKMNFSIKTLWGPNNSLVIPIQTHLLR